MYIKIKNKLQNPNNILIPKGRTKEDKKKKQLNQNSPKTSKKTLNLAGLCPASIAHSGKMWVLEGFSCSSHSFFPVLAPPSVRNLLQQMFCISGISNFQGLHWTFSLIASCTVLSGALCLASQAFLCNLSWSLSDSTILACHMPITPVSNGSYQALLPVQKVGRPPWNLAGTMSKCLDGWAQWNESQGPNSPGVPSQAEGLDILFSNKKFILLHLWACSAWSLADSWDALKSSFLSLYKVVDSFRWR